MIEKSEFIINFTKKNSMYANDISFAYHTNNFDWPQLHKHVDYWEFTILTNGSVSNYLNGNIEIYHKNTLFFATTQDIHSLKKAPDSEKLRYINLMVRESYLLDLLERISPSFSKNILKGARHYTLPQSFVDSIENIIHQVNLLKSSQYHLFNNLLCSAMLLILQFIFSQTIDIFENDPPWLNRLSVITLQPEFITYSVPDLCRELNYSNAHLTRMFRAYFNTTPNEYLIEWKFRYARNLLKNTDMKITDVCTTIGYANLSQFNSQFKKRFSMTPSQYRKNNKTIKSAQSSDTQSEEN
jgi:AraC-like DNA-binding protein